MVDERKEKRKQRLRVEKDLIRRNQAVRKTYHQQQQQQQQQ
jgi:hypothetical protein